MHTDNAPSNPDRRRAIRIAASALAGLAAGPVRATLTGQDSFSWEGRALGARATLELNGVGSIRGQQIVRRVTDEVDRLEKLFSLYRSDSELVRLNREGTLAHPSPDWLQLLSAARGVSEITGGAFDVTIQPLWRALAREHGFPTRPVSAGEHPSLESARSSVDYRKLVFDRQAVRFLESGMGATLNGIAQGYVTDKVARLLRAEGLHNVLIELGEIRALDDHPAGRPWQVGLEDPGRPGHSRLSFAVEDQAVATSSGHGTPFDAEGRAHHLINPHSGGSTNHYASLSIIGPNATLADALSTGLYQMMPAHAKRALGRFPGYSAHVLLSDRKSEFWAAS